MTSRLRLPLVCAMVVAVVAAAVMSYRYADPDRVAGHLGPTPGPSSEGHVAAKKGYLARLAATEPTTDAAALVSLNRLVPGSAAQAMARTGDATAVGIKFPGSDPEVQIVRTTISGAVADRVADLRNEYEAEITALEDAGSEDVAAQRKAELAEIAADCACVFAFALERARIGELEALAKRPEVKLVDVPEPVTDDLAGWQLVPIVPKEGGK